jgi:hypothetical protein
MNAISDEILEVLVEDEEDDQALITHQTQKTMIQVITK